MNIVDKANELGKLLENSKQYNDFRISETEFLNDNQVQKLLSEYKQFYIKYNQTKDEKIAKIVDEKYNDLLKNKVYARYISSKTEFETLMTTVNELVNRYVQFDKKGCSSNCGGCHKKKNE